MSEWELNAAFAEIICAGMKQEEIETLEALAELFAEGGDCE